MLHLSPERLAALADSEPTAVEADHLAICAACAREHAASRSLLVMARAEREHLGMPLTRWDSLAPELHRDGLVAAGALMTAPREGVSSSGTRPPGRRRVAAWLQAAAMLLLVAGGAAVGRLSAGVSPLPSGEAVEPPGQLAIRGGPAAVAPTSPLAGGVGVGRDASGPQFGSVDEALAALTRFEVAYQEAASYLADHDPTLRLDDPRGYRTRLAALDRAGRAMRDALREAPYDPVINVYYLSTLGQRQATLRQLNTTLPEDRQILSF